MPILTLSIGQDSDDVQVADDGTGYTTGGSYVAALSNSAASARLNMGLRVTNVTIAATDTINSAKIRLNIDSTFRDDADLDIFGVLEPNPATFNGTTRRPYSGDLTLTTASVSWAATSLGTGYVDSPSIISIIEELKAQGSWASGNAMAFVLRGKTNANNRDVSTVHYGANPAATAEVVIDHSPAPASGLAGIGLMGGRLISRHGRIRAWGP